MIEPLHQGRDRDVVDGANTGGRAKLPRRLAPPARHAPFKAGQLPAIEGRQHALFEIRMRDELSAQARYHGRTRGHAAASSIRVAGGDGGPMAF